jgi:excisionase family DNA binding protein
MNDAGINLQFSADIFEPLVVRIVREFASVFEEERARLDEKLAFSEEEAARLLGLARHQLRDERLRGRIQASQIVGRRIRYRREDLMTYLANRKWSPGKAT